MADPDRIYAPFDPSDEQITEAAFAAAMAEAFRGGRRPLAAPPGSRWDRYNDLVELTQLYWRLRPSPPIEEPELSRWNRFRALIEGLIDLSSRQRYWLEFVLTAEAEELEMWRNGEHAASVVNDCASIVRRGAPAPIRE